MLVSAGNGPVTLKVTSLGEFLMTSTLQSGCWVEPSMVHTTWKSPLSAALWLKARRTSAGRSQLNSWPGARVSWISRVDTEPSVLIVPSGSTRSRR